MVQNISFPKSIRIFFSYSNKDREIVGELKKHLKVIGFEIFLAHEDINPSLEWPDEIIKNLKECDIFIPYLTENFKESEWTDQETGIAISEGKFPIPLKVNFPPYGFIKNIQGLKFNPDNVEDMAIEIVKTIINSKKFGNLKEFFIEQFVNSNSYYVTKKRVGILSLYNDFSDEQVKFICKKSIENNQIHEQFAAKDFLRGFLSRYKEIINLDDYEALNKSISKQYNAQS